MFPRVLVLQLDYHKTLPCPKISAQDSHFLRKLRTNLLGIYCANEQHIHCFFYDDTIGGAGPNEVISSLNHLLNKLEAKYGRFDQLTLWSDNAPGQFKECFLFFYLEYLVKKGQFLRVDLKFLLEGHSFSICDRRFGCIQSFFDTVERVEVPKEWASLLKNSHLQNVEVHWMTLDMIMDFKSWLKGEYIARNEDVDKQKFEVRRVAWFNFGYGEVVDHAGNLKLVHHPGTAFVRFTIDTKEKPTTVSFYKKRQIVELDPELLVPVRHEQKPVDLVLKEHCLKLSQKYLSRNAQAFYASLSSENPSEKKKK